MKSIKKISLLVWNLSTNDGFIRASLLGEALNKLGYESEILGFLFQDQLYGAISNSDKIQAVSGGNYPQFFNSVQQLLPKIDGDVIYAIKPQVPSFGVALLKKLLSHKPIILDIDDWEMSWNGGDEWRYQPAPKQLARDILKANGALRSPVHPLYIQGMEKLIRYADQITTHTKFLQKRFGGTSVPNGKDINLFDPTRYSAEESRARLGLSEYRVLMFPGAPRPYKGLEDILIALEQLNQDDIKLVIVGGSPYDEYDDQLIQRWGKWIIQLPKTPAIMMPEVVAAAHVVVVPQRDVPAAQAQFPLKLTDGMAMAKPILATKVGDIPEILGETGYLVESGSPEQIAQTLTEIFNNFGDAQAKGLQARQRCIENYSIDAMAIILEEVINKLR
jgi:glycosyltransferase involved in cell wall biosynthesis